MKIHYEWGAKGSINASERGDICILIDIFRASSTIVTALALGFKRIVPIALLPKKKLTGLIAGERNGKKISGCDFGNSPTELCLANKISHSLYLKTSNGSACLIPISHSTAPFFIGCLLNATAVVKTVADLSKEMQKDISFVLAGVHGKYCEDDQLVGNFLAQSIHHYLNHHSLPTHHYPDIKMALANSQAAKLLVKKGYEKDVNFCLEIDYYSLLPVYDPVKKIVISAQERL